MPKANSRRLDKAEKNVLVHLLQAPKLTNGDIARIIDVDERTISRRRKQLRTLGHLSPERNVKGAEKLRPWHLERIIALLQENDDLQLKDLQEFLKGEFDLHVTVSTISRQLSRANHARAKRPGYKNTRPEAQAQGQQAEQQLSPQLQQLQPLQPQALSESQSQPQQEQQLFVQPVAEIQDVSTVSDPSQISPQPQLVVEGVDGLGLQQAASGTPAQTTAGQQPLKMACPFFRRNPQRYLNASFCQNSWQSVKDIKEHIFRQHMIPRFRCNRCMENFEDNKALVLHQRQPQPCNLAEWVSLEGCDEDQKDKMRRGDKGEETSRWRRLYRILFPDVGIEAVPDGVVYDNATYFAGTIDPTLDWQQSPLQQVQQGAI